MREQGHIAADLSVEEFTIVSREAHRRQVSVAEYVRWVLFQAVGIDPQRAVRKKGRPGREKIPRKGKK